jgi:hypothetical protein
MRSFGLADALVDWFSAGKTFAHAVPMRDALLAKLPAEQYRTPIYFTREVEQADV